MAVDRDIFGPQGEGEKELFALESLVFSVQVALQKAMNKHGVTSKELAERIGMSPARVSQIFAEKGPNLTLKTIAKIQSALGEDFEFISKADVREMKRKVPDKRFAMVALREVKAVWQEVTPRNLNRRTELAAAA